MKKLGVYITGGPQNWQIVQQCGGAADIGLEGEWFLPENNPADGRVYIRVVREDSGECVLPWARCAAAGENRWRTVLRVPAGGLYRIETCLHQGEPVAMEWGWRGDARCHLGVGEVFVIAGQSNSGGYAKDVAYDPPELGVHLLRNTGCWDLASHPMNDSTDTVHEANREEFNPGSSPWLSFGKAVRRELGCPVGLLQTALGGSALERWNPAEEGSLYRNLLSVLASQGGRAAGVLWMQGCNDTEPGPASGYYKRFEQFVTALRADTGLENLPFYTVQLNRYLRAPAGGKDESWSAVREAQRRAARQMPGVYMVPSIDLPLSDAIHLSAQANCLLGERTARMALAKTYGRSRICMAPDVRCARLENADRVSLFVDNISSRLYNYNVETADLPFFVEDGAGTVPITDAVFEDERITLVLARPLQGAAFVSGAPGQNPRGTMPVDYEGHLPLIPFWHVPVTVPDVQNP